MYVMRQELGENPRLSVFWQHKTLDVGASADNRLSFRCKSYVQIFPNNMVVGMFWGYGLLAVSAEQTFLPEIYAGRRTFASQPRIWAVWHDKSDKEAGPDHVGFADESVVMIPQPKIAAAHFVFSGPGIIGVERPVSIDDTPNWYSLLAVSEQ